MSRKAEKEARQKLLGLPWWKVKGNWYALGVLFLVFVVLGLLAATGDIGTGAGISRGVKF